MAEKKFIGAPFGTQIARFDVSGVHPQSKMPGTLTQVSYCKKQTSNKNIMLGPGSYNIDRYSIKHRMPNEICGMDWDVMYRTEKLARVPKQSYSNQWEKNKFLNESRGPGMYETKTFVDVLKQRPCSVRGICNTTGQRIHPENKDLVNNPAAGSYGEGGLPFAVIEAKSRNSSGIIGILNNGGRGRELQLTLGSDLSPAQYLIQSSIDKCILFKASKRGPYDLFTGKRTDPVPNGHLVAEQIKWCKLGPGQYEIASFLEDFNCDHNRLKGRFSKLDHFNTQPSERIYCDTLSQYPRPKTAPGPNHYILQKDNKLHYSNKPFLSSSERTDKRYWKDFMMANNDVGAGRYSMDKWPQSQDKNGHKSAFVSKKPRIPYNAESPLERLLKERITPKTARTGKN